MRTRDILLRATSSKDEIAVTFGSGARTSTMDFNCSKCIPILLLLLSSMWAGAQVISWDLGKAGFYRQTDEGTTPTVADGWGVFMYIEVSSAEATTATISGGGISGNITIPREGDEFNLDLSYGSEAAMDAVFPNNSTYTMTLSGGSLGIITQQIVVGAADYPTPATLMQGELARGLSLDSTQDHLFRWKTPDSNVDAIYLELGDDEDDWEFDGSDTSGALPADTLVTGQCGVGVGLAFDSLTDVSGSVGFGVDGYFSHASLTRFTLSTVLTATPQAIVGAWQFGNGTPGDSGVLVFQANGVYYHAQDITDSDTELYDGMERGTYTWNSGTGAFSSITQIDTNGEIGLSDPLAAFTMMVVGDNLTITEGGDSFSLSRVGDSATNAIQGGWMICDEIGMVTGCLVFLANNTYFHMEVFSADGSDGNSDTNGVTGMERGSYSFNLGNGRLDASLIEPDTNSEWGLSDPIIGYHEIDVLSERVLIITDDGPGAPTAELHRISNETLEIVTGSGDLLNDTLAGAGLTGGNATFLAEPFGDGVPNLLKYAFNMDLSGPDAHSMASGGSSGLPGGAVVEENGQTFWRVEFVRRVGSGLIYIPKKSTTLLPGSFAPLSGEQEVTAINAEWERVTVDEPCDPATTPKCFSHVDVVAP